MTLKRFLALSIQAVCEICTICVIFASFGCIPKKKLESESLSKRKQPTEILNSDCKKSLISDKSSQFFHGFIPAKITGGREFYVIGALVNLPGGKQSLGLGPIALGEHEALTKTINPNVKSSDVIWAGEIALKASEDCKKVTIVAANLTSGTYKPRKGIDEYLVPFLDKEFPGLRDLNFKQRGPVGAHILEPFNFFFDNFRHDVEAGFFKLKLLWVLSLTDKGSKSSTLKEFAADAKFGIREKEFGFISGAKSHFKNSKSSLSSYLNQKLGKWLDARPSDELSPMNNLAELLGSPQILTKEGGLDRIVLDGCLSFISQAANADPQSIRQLILNLTCLDDIGWLLSKAPDDIVLKDMGEQILADNSAFLGDPLPMEVSTSLERTQLAMAGSGPLVQALRTYLSYALADFKSQGKRYTAITENLDRLNRIGNSIRMPKATPPGSSNAEALIVKPLKKSEFEELRVFLSDLKYIVCMDPVPTEFGDGGEVTPYVATAFAKF